MMQVGCLGLLAFIFGGLFLTANSTSTQIDVLPTTEVQIPCNFNWATQSDENLTQQVQALVDFADVIVSQYGENCYNNDGSVQYFAVMETDFNFVIAAEAPSDEQLIAILEVLAQFPVAATPGPQPGRVTVEFQGENTARFIFDYNQGRAAFNQNLTGNDLFEALGGLR